MARRKTTPPKRTIESYEHKKEERVNNPPVGLVTPETDPDAGQKRTYAYDPHLDPQLQWAGKAEHTSFEVPTVSLHVHERIEPRTILEAVRKRNGDAARQPSLFEMDEKPLREAIEFYKHKEGWTNRLIAGDSLLVMNSLLEKEGMAGKVQMVYFDPPYGIRYGSNFQPFVNKRDVKDGRDEDLTAEPEQIRAFRDTWELGIHSYLTYLRDRLLLARELLTESGSVFVQISDENVHHVREVMDEVFGSANQCATIIWKKGTSDTSTIRKAFNYILWYTKDIQKATSQLHKLYLPRLGNEGSTDDPRKLALWGNFQDDTSRPLTTEEKRNISATRERAKVFRVDPVLEHGDDEERKGAFLFEGQKYYPKAGQCWRGKPLHMERLSLARRIIKTDEGFGYKFYVDDYPIIERTNLWEDTGSRIKDQVYVVQTQAKIIERCILMTTDPGDLVLDPTCGSGTTAYIAEQWGRRWITCDTSRVALTLAKQRLMTAVFDYYELAHPQEGVGSGFKYNVVPHITLKVIANNPHIKDGMTLKQIDAVIARDAPGETLYDQPIPDDKKTRVSGPFTVEAVPAPAVKSVEELLEGAPQPADTSIVRSGETLRQGEWRDELLRTGIRGKAGQRIRFSRLEPLPGCRWLHADGETRPNDEGADSVREGGAVFSPQRVVVAFGPEHAPLEQRQVEMAWEEARTLVPKPKLLVFATFQFDPEAAKDIDEMKTELAGMQFLKVQMNADLLTDDLKKKRASNESFWLIGQPDVQAERIAKGEDKGKYRVSVHGFDYYNTKNGELESGGSDRIAVWLLDTDYDGRSLYPRQVFFPMAGENEGWAKLARNLKAEVDEERIEAYRGTESLPFEAGEHRRVAIKIVDDRGIESLKVLEVE